MEIIFIDFDNRGYERLTSKPIEVESAATANGNVTMTISAAGKCWLRLNLDKSEAAAIGHSILAACQNVSTVLKAGE